MEIIKGHPPNFDAIVAVFPHARYLSTIFAYGTVIYYRGPGTLTPALLAHEAVHGERQLAFGLDAWWERYLRDAEFRYREELPAHQAEWRKFKVKVPMPSRKERDQMLAFIAQRLSGPLYGNMISLDEAKMRVQE